MVVTHDQTEAMTMADQIVVMGKAKVLQTGGPMDIYKRPADKFVAGFIGTSNLLPAQMTGEDTVRVSGVELKVGGVKGDHQSGENVLLMTRPEEVFVHPGTDAPPANAISGTVTFVRDIGATIEILVDCAGHEVISVLTPKDWPDVKVGEAVNVEMPAAACNVLAA